MKPVLLMVATVAALGCGRGDRNRSASDSTAADSASTSAGRTGDVQLKLPSGFSATFSPKVWGPPGTSWPDGALYISDDQRGTIWRVAYKP